MGNKAIVREGGTGKTRSRFGFHNRRDARDGLLLEATEQAPLPSRRRTYAEPVLSPTLDENAGADGPSTVSPIAELSDRKPKLVLSDEERNERKIENKTFKVLAAVAGTTAVASAALYMGPETALAVPAFMLMSTAAAASTIFTAFAPIVIGVQRRHRRLMDEAYAEHRIKMQATADRIWGREA